MNYTLKLSLLTLAGALAFTACKKKDTPVDPVVQPVPQPGQTASLTELKNYLATNLANATQTFTMDEDAGQTITGAQGTIITFNANSFVTQSGAAVTGNIDIELVEIYNKKDMILMNAATMGRQWDNTYKPLISGGEYKITAKQNGQLLDLAPGAGYSATVPAMGGVVDPNMSLFYGEGENDPDTLMWNSADSAQFTGQGNQYFFWSDSVNWVNCDYFMNNTGAQTVVQATPPAGFNNNNMLLFLSFDGLNTVCNVYGFAGGNFTTAPNYTLPITQQVHFVAIAVINGTPQVSVVPATIVNNHVSVIPTLTPTTTAQLTTTLNALP